MSPKARRTDEPSESKAVKWTLISLAVVAAALVEHFCPGWGKPALITLGIFGSVVVFCQPYWSTAFWTVAIGTFALHSALMFHFQVTINALRVPALFVWAVGELIVIAIILGLVFPDRNDSTI